MGLEYVMCVMDETCNQKDGERDGANETKQTRTQNAERRTQNAPGGAPPKITPTGPGPQEIFLVMMI